MESRLRCAASTRTTSAFCAGGGGKRYAFPEVINQVFHSPALGSTCAVACDARAKTNTWRSKLFFICYIFMQAYGWIKGSAVRYQRIVHWGKQTTALRQRFKFDAKRKS